MKKTNRIPTIIGIVMLVVGIFAGVFFLNMNQVFRIGADVKTAPTDIRVSNISDNSATISWTTDKESLNFISWGESANSLPKIEKETEADQKFVTHSITLTGLTPGKKFFYKINSDGTNYDNKGIAWEVSTGPTLNVNQNTNTVSGAVINASGLPAKRALVYMTINGYLLSTLTSDNGNYVFQIGNTRTTDLLSYAQIDPAQTLLEISVVGGVDGVSTAKVFPQSAHPVPTIILGQVYDFRSLPINAEGQIPEASLNLPEDATASSKFNVEGGTATPSSSVILESLKEGEVITTDQPQFFGKGPGGETITITVNSETPITDVIEIPKNGSWNWNVPANLAPGAHTINISWVDATGITRSLTRSFVVQASELPAFEASSSATSTPSIIATPTSSGSATIKPTSTPNPTPAATSQPVPVTGSLTGTILLSIIGIAVLLFSFAILKIAED
ncbi:MAG TPA: fibronectin type III domain-containing protein [Patescibacteria group bacterium]|nr:fibronectin type III domain-containing protein [Patescibacteria group bacterium]